MRTKWITLVGIFAILSLVVLVVIRTGVISFDTAPDKSETPFDLGTFTALPYTNFVVESEERKQKTGVTLYDEARCYPGLNLYSNHYSKTTGAFLIDMEGEVVHKWTGPDSSTWKAFTLDDNGFGYGVLHGDDRFRFVKVDWHSNVLFEVPGDFHHDIEFLDDGTIVTLRQSRTTVRRKEKRIAILENQLVLLSPDGQMIEDIPLFPIIRRRPVVHRVLDEAVVDARYPLDIMHTNTADVLRRDIPGFCKKGNILLCMRNLNLVLVFDYDTKTIVWEYDGDERWQHPHEPKLLDNGRLLILDNGRWRGWSQVIEMDPLTKKFEWRYKGDRRNAFFTEVRGSTQRFANGNTLITESETGRVFEVTSKGKVVWEWYNPVFSDKGRAIVYRMKRLDRSTVEAWMAEAGL